MADNIVGTVIPGGAVAVPSGPVGVFLPVTDDLHVDGILRVGRLTDDAQFFDDGSFHISNATNMWLGRGNPGSFLFVRFENVNIQADTTTINSGVGNWQFRVNAPGTTDARIWYDLQGQRGWTAGLHYNGRCFAIADESAGAIRLYIRWEPYESELSGRLICNEHVVANQLRFPNPDQPWAFHGGGGLTELWYHDGGGVMNWQHDRVLSRKHIMCANNDNQWCGVDVWGYSWYALSSHHFNTASDPAEKNDISPMTESVIDKIIALTPVNFRWNSDPDDGRHHRGFLAPDVRDAMGPDFAGYSAGDDPSVAGPLAKTVDPATVKGHQSIDYNELIAVLWRGVQELTEQVRELKRKRQGHATKLP